VTLTVKVAVAAISALFLKIKKSARTQKNVTNSELGKDSGGMMMINNCKITRSQDQGRPTTVLAGGMSITRGVPRATKSVAHDISPARSGPDNNKWKKIG